MLSLRGAMVGFVVLAAELSPAPADACSPQRCTGGELLPRGSAPANLPGILWQPTVSPFGAGSAPAADGIRIFAANGATVAADVEKVGDNFLWRPQSNLRSDEQYVIATEDYCSAETYTEMRPLRILSSTAAFPTELGELQIGAPGASVLQVWNNSPACFGDFDAWASSVSITLSESAFPWRSALAFKLYVDGSRWVNNRAYSAMPGPLSDGPNNTVYVVCSAPPESRFTRRLSRGWHSIRMEATLPGVPGVLRTLTHDVFFSCGIEPPDAGLIDAPSAEDATTEDDAGVRGSPKPRFEVVQDEQAGCDCRSSDLGDTSPAGLLLGAWLFMTRTRWRKNRNSQPG